MATLPPPPTYTTDQAVWTDWFVVISQAITSVQAGNLSHNNLLNIQGGNSTERYHLLNSEYSQVQHLGATKGATSAITVGASPFTYTNGTIYEEDVIIQGGTVSLIQFSRGGVATDTGFTSGIVRLSPNDSVVVTYSASPNMTLVPR